MMELPPDPPPQEPLPEDLTVNQERAVHQRRWTSYAREIIETLILALLIFLAVKATVQNFRVEGISMDPNLEHGQYIIVNKLAYATFDLSVFDFLPFFDAGPDDIKHLFGEPGRGDVIVFHSIQDPSVDFIKRVIGAPGDTVEIRDGTVFINGEPLEEDYTHGATNCHRPTQHCGPLVLEEGEYFVLGDNRTSSSDSRLWGPVPKENIVGKALFTYWPLSDLGLAPNHHVSFAHQ